MLLPVLSAFGSLDSRASLVLKIITSLAGLWMGWRMWKFTIYPALHPHEPKRLPYWIPFLGHAIPFFRDSEATLAYARKFFGNTREPFTLTVAGQKFFIVMSPKDMSTVYKNSTTLTFDGFIRDLYTTFGVSAKGIEQMWQAHSSKLQEGGSSRVHLGQGIHREQLHPGDHLEDMTKVYMAVIEQSLQWGNLPAISAHGKTKVVPLYQWCQTVLGHASTRAFFGDVLLELEPGLLEHFYAFDAESWKLTFQLPPLLAREMHAAKDKSRHAYLRYFQLPQEQRPGTCHYIRSVEAKQRGVGMTDLDIAITAQMFFWGANANPFKVTFWLLCHILHTPSLLHAIRAEVAPSISPTTNKLDIAHLLSSAPTLDAAFNETLRITSVNSSARNISAPVVVGNKTLTPDGKIMMPYRQLHLDEAVWGPLDPKTFSVERWLHGNADASRNAHFKPFGGGSTYCSGRFIAKREVLAFVAVAVSRFEMRLEEEGAFPRMDETKPTLGIMDPVGGGEGVNVVVVERRL